MNIEDSKLRTLTFQTGYTAELLVKVIKWFFIEQDVTYWNYSGRAKLLHAIQNIS